MKDRKRHGRPCPVFTKGMTRSQKAKTKDAWKAHFSAWRLEHDPVFMSFMTGAVRNLRNGHITHEGFIEKRNERMEESLKRRYTNEDFRMATQAWFDGLKEEQCLRT
tara:strand:+ start:43 stop:363 length:321 start_codon:yes stop_codon:yes gene_type:complete